MFIGDFQSGKLNRILAILPKKSGRTLRINFLKVLSHAPFVPVPGISPPPLKSLKALIGSKITETSLRVL